MGNFIKNSNTAYHRRLSGVQWTTTPWLEKADILQLLHINSRTLQNWRSQGIIPFTRINGKIYYKEEEVQVLMEGRKVGSSK